jgi:phage FluMu protein Com
MQQTQNNNSSELTEIHCIQCGRFLALAAIAIGIVQIKCPKCKAWTTVSNWPDEELDKGLEVRYADRVKTD